MMTHKELGERIETIRMNKNLTRDQLAAQAGLSSKFIYEVEKGKKGMSVDSLIKIGEVFDCSYDEILVKEKKDCSF